MQEEPQVSEAESHPQKTRLIWRGLICLIILTVICSTIVICWPIYQATQLIRFARDHGGGFEIEHQHPEWLSGFVDQQAYLPWWDEVHAFHLSQEPLSKRQWNQLQYFQSLKDLYLDVSQCESVELTTLGEFEQLSSLRLDGCREEMDLAWLSRLPNLRRLSFDNSILNQQQWSCIISQPSLEDVWFSDADTRIILERNKASGEYTGARISKNITSEHAEFLLELPHLSTVDVRFQNMEPEFWEVLGKHPNIEGLRIAMDSSLDSKYEFSDVEIQTFVQMKSLKEIYLLGGIHYSPGPEMPESWKQFHRTRPDVEVNETELMSLEDI